MVGELVGNNLSVNAKAVVTAGNWRGQSTGFLTGGNLCDLVLALAASTLVTTNFPNEEFGGDQVESFSNVRANDRHLFATARAHSLLGGDVRLDDFASEVRR